ncbi:MAG: hypothetical protein KJ623_00360 [Nanoarchaeota archaeon]|nr:hypothetical protein [Nanoarchaeota archaeon]MBU0962427.1 hypothetical protein [Nanoarchaeota archaeon]
MNSKKEYNSKLIEAYTCLAGSALFTGFTYLGFSNEKYNLGIISIIGSFYFIKDAIKANKSRKDLEKRLLQESTDLEGKTHEK